MIREYREASVIFPYPVPCPPPPEMLMGNAGVILHRAGFILWTTIIRQTQFTNPRLSSGLADVLPLPPPNVLIFISLALVIVKTSTLNLVNLE